MKSYIVILILCISVKLIGQKDTLRVNGHTFITVKQTEKNEFDGKDTLMKLFKLNGNTKTYLLSHYLYRYSADCNNTFKDKGSMACHGDSVTFMTTYMQEGHDPIPEKQKQIYKVHANGKFTLLSDRIYINGKWIDAKDQ